MYVPVPQPEKIARHPRLGPLIVASLILLVAAGAGFWALAGERERVAERDRATAAEVSAEIESVLGGTVGGLRGLRGFLDASGDIDPRSFSVLSTQLLTDKTLIGTQWVSWVPSSRRAEFEKRMGITITAPGGAPAPAQPSAGGFGVVSHVAPQELHKDAIGVDHLSDPGRRRALISAARRDVPLFSPPTPLALEDNPLGILVSLPVYRGEMPPKTREARQAALRGWVAGVYELDGLATAVERRVASQATYRVTDGTNVIFSSGEVPDGGAVQALSVGGRQWRIQARSDARVDWTATIAVLLCGALVALLSALILREARRREMAALATAAAQRERAAAEERLRVNERHYHDLLDSAPDGVIAIDDDGSIISANPAAHGIFDRSPGTLVGLHLSAVVTGPGISTSPPKVARDALGTADLTGVRADGTELTIQATIASDPTPGREAYTVSLRDVSHERRAAAEEQALRAVATAVASEGDPREIFDLVARRACELERADSACVTRMESGAGRVVGNWGSPADDPRGRGAAGRAWRIGDPVIIFDHVVETENGKAFARTTGIRSEVAVPVRVGGRLWGVLSLRSAEPYAFRSGAEGRLERFTELIGMAIANADARAQLTAMASTDSLTGIPNQRAFNARLVEEAAAAENGGEGLCLAVFDVDHFKRVNDTLGHQVGDAVLVEIAARLSALLPERDMLARVGGEEFAWIMVGVDPDRALEQAEQARRAICDTEITGVGRVTISAGVARFDAGLPAGDLFRHADLALYLAKSRGRDRCVPYVADEVEGLPGRGATDAEERRRRAASIHVLARAVDAKDGGRPRHSERVAAVSEAIGRELGWSADPLARLREAALVHDVGKIGVPDQILTRVGELEPDEFRQVMVHAELGARIVEGALSGEQASWVRCHHERFDGAGYPDGLSGTAIPAGARIIAVADAWDAMTRGRFYRPARSVEDVLREIRRESGRQFCPEAVDSLVSLHEQGKLPHRTRAGMLAEHDIPDTPISGSVSEQPDDVPELGDQQVLETETHRVG